MAPSSHAWAGSPCHRLGTILSLGQRRHRRALALLYQSSLFDRGWYLDRYPDVARSGIDPARHFLDFGWQEGRDPGPGFSTSAYLRANADVAALGINPLLHFVEHGHAEGRGAPGQAAPARASVAPRQKFGAAAPCASFPVQRPAPIRWKSGGAAGAGLAEAVVHDARRIGAHRDDEAKQLYERSLALLAHLSGDGAAPGNPFEPCTELALADAWHAGMGLLRSRWVRPGQDAMVMRVLQHHGGQPMLVGEALLSGTLDVVDARPANPCFPLLFVFGQPDGLIVGQRLLAFPSLCRGGLHYLEAVALSVGGQAVDPLGLSDALLASLLAVRGAGTAPLIGSIDVDLSGADGTHPLFRQDFQQWLEQVMRVAVEPLGSAGAGPAFDHLSAAVRRPVTGRSNAAGALVLASDMIPSISALVAPGGGRCPPGARRMVPFVAANADSSRPATRIAPPSDWQAQAREGLVPAYPHFRSLGGAGPGDALRVAAIRSARAKMFSEAEILVPLAASEARDDEGEPLTWLVSIGNSSDEPVLETLESLALQTGIGAARLILVGTASPPVAAVAERLFERLAVAADFAAAVASVDTRTVGHVAAGIVLHDSRAASTMGRLLAEPGIESTSLVVLSLDQRGKGWIASPADVGEVHANAGAIADDSAVALDLWRSSWPVARPPRGLWLARAESMPLWLAQPAVALGQHMCSSLATASFIGSPPATKALFSPPPSADALAIERLVG